MSAPRFHLRWAAVIVWLLMCGVIICLADRGLLRPIYKFIGVYPGSDKIGHFVLIGASAGLLNLALGLRTVRWLGRDWLLGSVVIAVFCTVEEISQHWLPARSFDLLDLAGDYAGIFFFGWLAKWVARRRGQD
jgi:hypothetical protein